MAKNIYHKKDKCQLEKNFCNIYDYQRVTVLDKELYSS